MRVRPLKCREHADGCRVKYIPMSSFQVTCANPACALKKTIRDRENKELIRERDRRVELREKKNAIKSRSKLLTEAQIEFNRYIRARDGHVCITCYSRTAVQYHAGHYQTTKARPGLRFHPGNCHSQCSQCNLYHSGKIHEYRPALIFKLGKEMVDYLDTAHPASDWTKEEIIEIKLHFRELRKRLIDLL